MLPKLAIVPILFAVLFVSAAGCGKANKEVTFKPVPEGTPTVNTGTPSVNTGTPTVNTGTPTVNTGTPAPPKSKPVEDR